MFLIKKFSNSSEQLHSFLEVAPILRHGMVSSRFSFLTTELHMTSQEFRRLRKQIGLTQQGLAAILGCSRQHIVNMEGAVDIPAVYAIAMRAIHAQKLAEYAA